MGRWRQTKAPAKEKTHRLSILAKAKKKLKSQE
jgi:hypothetical protein